MLVKHSLTIAGHATSLTLEPVFWDALKAAAVADDKPLAALVAEIDEARTTNLSSAVRVWLFERAQRLGGQGMKDDVRAI
jgi:predicted DNA-binding ribbon-helix-helix protein